jgi:hypothetical protein
MKPILEGRLTPDGEDNPNHRALPTFLEWKTRTLSVFTQAA